MDAVELRYSISGLALRVGPLAPDVRGHWGIENGLHWQLDVSFDEDASRIQDRNAAENFAFMRKLALCLLKHNPAKMSMARKRKAAALDPDFLATTLMGAAKSANV